jgi:hypothetical protein
MILRRLDFLASLLAATFVLAVVLLAGCGGSGSSGFDGAADSEPDAIRQANDEGTCVEFDGIEYCASGAPVAVGDDSAVVDFDQPSDPLPCAALPDDPACSTSVGFSPDGFPPGTTFLGAWAESENGPWTLSSTEVLDPGGGEPSSDADRDVVVLLPDAGGSTPEAVIVAVLIYVGPLPADLPAVSLRLRGFAPDYVYFTGDVAVVPDSAPDGPPTVR